MIIHGAHIIRVWVAGMLAVMNLDQRAAIESRSAEEKQMNVVLSAAAIMCVFISCHPYCISL